MQRTLPGVSPEALARWTTIDHLDALNGQVVMPAVEAFHRVADLKLVLRDHLYVGVRRVESNKVVCGAEAEQLLSNLVHNSKTVQEGVVVAHLIRWVAELDGATPLNAVQAEERLKLAALLYSQHEVELHHVPTTQRLYMSSGDNVIGCARAFLRKHAPVGNVFQVTFARTDNNGTVNGA